MNGGREGDGGIGAPLPFGITNEYGSENKDNDRLSEARGSASGKGNMYGAS